MTYRLPLPAPPEILQEPHQCWSAAYESWSRACAAAYPAASVITEEDIETAIGRFPNALSEDGGATHVGIFMLSRVGNMNLEPVPAAAMTTEFAREKMRASGYIYLVYYAMGTSGSYFSHAVVIYGTNSRGFMVMDPGADRGLMSRAPGYFNRTEGMLLGTHVSG